MTARYSLISSFNQVRPSFLAAIDQIVAEMRPKMGDPDFYTNSVLACAFAFADPALMRYQLASIEPELLDEISEDEVHDAHMASVAYLFSLALHELIRHQQQEVLPS